MNRGEVWWVNFEPATGGEIKKQRPAIIISNDISNKYLNRVQVVPVSSKIDKIYPSESLISLNDIPNKAMADQLTTVSKQRLLNFIGKISQLDLIKIEKAIKIQLDMK